ncbi:MAG: FtsX-like permease family protein, partial [Cyanobacteria bacterium J06638_22]
VAASVPGVEVFTHEELIAKELAYHETNPTGPIFTFGAVMGFVVGVVIVYQVLYADINDHLNEYATLKAIGYSNRSLLSVVIQEALLLGVLGFIPGYGISLGMYWFLVYLTELELVMRASIAASVFALTMLMCLLSATIASRKLRSADPADVF